MSWSHQQQPLDTTPRALTLRPPLLLSNPTIAVAILTGAGEKAFCAGADLKRLITLTTGARCVSVALARPDALTHAAATRTRKAEDQWDVRYSEESVFTSAFLRNFDLKKPIIAAINGFAVAGGRSPSMHHHNCAAHSRSHVNDQAWSLYKAVTFEYLLATPSLAFRSELHCWCSQEQHADLPSPAVSLSRSPSGASSLLVALLCGCRAKSRKQWPWR